MGCRLRGLDLIGELEGELERPIHVELALAISLRVIRVLAANPKHEAEDLGG